MKAVNENPLTISDSMAILFCKKSLIGEMVFWHCLFNEWDKFNEIALMFDV